MAHRPKYRSSSELCLESSVMISASCVFTGFIWIYVGVLSLWKKKNHPYICVLIYTHASSEDARTGFGSVLVFFFF